MIHVNVYSREHGGGILVEEVPAGDRTVQLSLDERAQKTFLALCAVNSLEISYFLGQFFLACAKHSHQETRKVKKTA